jgi:hypothetical protein
VSLNAENFKFSYFETKGLIMRINTVIKHDLESRAKDLKASEKTLDEIAFILSNESKQTVTKSAVFRYFESNEKAAVQVIEKQDKLKAKIAEAEISTIEQRIQVIDGLLDLAKDAEMEHVRVNAYKAANEALDSLDARLGKLNPHSALIQINNNNPKMESMSDAELIGIIKREEALLNQGVDGLE